MITIEEFYQNAKNVYEKYLENWKTLKLDEYPDKIKEIENKMSAPDFWDNPDEANKTSKEVSDLKKLFKDWNDTKEQLQSIIEIADMLKEEKDDNLFKEIQDEFIEAEKGFKKKELYLYFRSKFDENNCYLSINAGAGGTESNDWVSMLTRMYLRWAENQGYDTEIVDELPGEEAGIKNITLLIKGIYGYGKLKGENGVHRLVRISPFDSNSRRHTSFASVSIIPEIIDDIEIEINPSDLRIDTYRASGAGGQHVNKTDSAVRIVHNPTGIVVQCQQERSQHKNKEKAMKLLKARLYQHYEEKKQEEHKEFEGEKKDISWGSQIRSYVFQPYTLIKDHRTNFEIGNVQKVMDGEIDDFIFEYLKWTLKKSA
mgnify:CR=1 FL=1